MIRYTLQAEVDGETVAKISNDDLMYVISRIPIVQYAAQQAEQETAEFFEQLEDDRDPDEYVPEVGESVCADPDSCDSDYHGHGGTP